MQDDNHSRHNTSMKKTLFLAALLLIASASTKAQKEQDCDTLLWGSRKYTVTVERYEPSILQSYYMQTGKELPFQSWSNNNNRGHIATFEIVNETLYLNTIEAKRYRTRNSNLWSASGIDTVVNPEYFDILPLHSDSSLSTSSQVETDWYSGVLTLKLVVPSKKEAKQGDSQGSWLMLIRNGHIEENVQITPQTIKKMESRPNDSESATIRKVIAIQKNMHTFYLNCSSNREPVTMDGHEGMFERKTNSLSLLMEQKQNDPMQWIDNWSDEALDSAQLSPTGNWIILHDSLFLTSPHQAFANWLNGEYVIQYGNWTDKFGMADYTVYKTQRIRVKGGVILSSKFSPRSFEEDERDIAASAFNLCNPKELFSVDDKQLAEAVGNFKRPKSNPSYKGDKTALRNYFLNCPLTDSRAKERLFRVRIGFMVNCKGEAGQWTLLTKGKGELNEFSNMVLEIVRNMPQKWIAATDKKGNAVDCWQILEFTVSNGLLTNANYK